MISQMKALRFPHYKQHDMMDCGPTCLKIISKFYGKFFDLEKIRSLSEIGKTGVSLLGISKAAENLGLHTVGGNMTYEKLQLRPVLPCIIHWRKNHFVVLYKMNRNKVYVSDPGSGLQTYTKEEFLNNWAYTQIHNEPAGIVLLVKPTTGFYDLEEDRQIPVNGIGYLMKHLVQYKTLLWQLFAGLLA
ncbi:MAG TPA: cysteine peptidase family C39 domain-containing protein, partial [Pedobacter sp.]